MHEDPILTESETAKELKVSPRTLQRWRVTGDGPQYIRIGLRRVGYRQSVCREWTACRTFSHSAAEIAQRAAA